MAYMVEHEKYKVLRARLLTANRDRNIYKVLGNVWYVEMQDKDGQLLVGEYNTTVNPDIDLVGKYIRKVGGSNNVNVITLA